MLDKDQRAVKLTVDLQDKVWLAEGSRCPASTGKDVDSFLSEGGLAKPGHLRVPGLRRNAYLLLKLYREVCIGFHKSLEVCSPRCCPTEAMRSNPELLLYRSRQYDIPVSVGGWHAFTENDFYSYLLAHRYNTGWPDQTSFVKEIYSHPTSKVLSFHTFIDPVSSAQLLGLIIDPRWFVDRDRPSRNNLLPEYLGLDPATQRSDLDNERTRRNRLVMACWKTSNPPPLHLLQPGQFVWRVWHDHGGGYKGDLAASKVFLEFLRLTWLAALVRPNQADDFFVPEHFFKDKADVYAFRHYL